MTVVQFDQTPLRYRLRYLFVVELAVALGGFVVGIPDSPDVTRLRCYVIPVGYALPFVASLAVVTPHGWTIYGYLHYTLLYGCCDHYRLPHGCYYYYLRLDVDSRTYLPVVTLDVTDRTTRTVGCYPTRRLVTFTVDSPRTAVIATHYTLVVPPHVAHLPRGLRWLPRWV